MTSARRPIRVTLVNDYEIIVQGLRRMLEPFSDRIEIVETQVGGVPDLPTDIALFDTFAGRRYALQRVRLMARDRSIGKVVLYTWDAPPAFRDDILRHEIDGVILKAVTGEALVESLERIHAGESLGLDGLSESPVSAALSEREQEVLALIALGMSNRQDRARALPVGRHDQDARAQRVRQARSGEPDSGSARRRRRRSRSAPHACDGLTGRTGRSSSHTLRATAAAQGVVIAVVDDAQLVHECGHDEQATPRDLAPIGQLDVIEDAQVVDIGDLQDPVIGGPFDSDRHRGRRGVFDDVRGQLGDDEFQVVGDVVSPAGLGYVGADAAANFRELSGVGGSTEIDAGRGSIRWWPTVVHRPLLIPSATSPETLLPQRSHCAPAAGVFRPGFRSGSSR